ncbi:GNAT family N-acetyltransferase [Sneathiella limimaris]|uniref:GNAT family N-acetyltransferase n=1 Tax=Sneathiella limimaris TaxID=1964213 RepID=UPI00146B0DF1|nr:GNAT family N-acetyltransferase [Sneathiella limimaris]
MIELIEKHSFQSLPSEGEEDYDGWLLRKSRHLAKRANSVNFPGRVKSQISLPDKIDHCEAVYRSLNQPVVFRMTKLADDGLVELLKDRGYRSLDETSILTRELETAPSADPTVVLTSQLDDKQFADLCLLTNKPVDKARIYQENLKRIPHKTLFGFIYDGDKAIAVGMATYGDGLMGLFEFATDPYYQRQGLATRILNTLVNQGIQNGISTAYLQVVTKNEKGTGFWQTQGFSGPLYNYIYYLKR